MAIRVARSSFDKQILSENVLFGFLVFRFLFWFFDVGRTRVSCQLSASSSLAFAAAERMAACDSSGSRPIFRSSSFRSARTAVFVSAPFPFINVLIAAGSAYWDKGHRYKVWYRAQTFYYTEHFASHPDAPGEMVKIG